MFYGLLMAMLSILMSDITSLDVDAIVNAANPALLGGGGVDGAIHRAAGPALVEACRDIPEVSPGVRCPTGEARITPGFALPARWVIHTVGPVWHGGGQGEPELLRNAYRNSLELAAKRGIRRIAFPGISTGVYGFPKDQAAAIAVSEMRRHEPRFQEIIICCFSDGDVRRYRGLLQTGGA